MRGHVYNWRIVGNTAKSFPVQMSDPYRPEKIIMNMKGLEGLRRLSEDTNH